MYKCLIFRILPAAERKVDPTTKNAQAIKKHYVNLNNCSMFKILSAAKEKIDSTTKNKKQKKSKETREPEVQKENSRAKKKVEKPQEKKKERKKAETKTHENDEAKKKKKGKQIRQVKINLIKCEETNEFENSHSYQSEALYLCSYFMFIYT